MGDWGIMMEWHYRCPICDEWRKIDWSKRFEARYCDNTESYYIPPSPSEQHDAYIDTHEWPDLMEYTVVTGKGNQCTVTGCTKVYETLDHRVPFSKGGKTSVDNLFPMCNDHNLSKGDSDYFTWLNDMIFKNN